MKSVSSESTDFNSFTVSSPFSLSSEIGCGEFSGERLVERVHLADSNCYLIAGIEHRAVEFQR